MTPKYSIDDDAASTREWQSDRRYVLAEWSTKPFQGHRHRHETVYQRVVIQYIPDVGVDLLYEARSEDTEKFDDYWAAVEIVEVRDYGVQHTRRPEARWLA